MSFTRDFAAKDVRRSLASAASSQRAPVNSLWQENWVSTVVLVALDVGIWFTIFCAVFEWRNGDLLAGNASEVLLLGTWPLLAILATLYVVDGYDRRTDRLSLTYMSEHLLGMVVAGLLAALLFYCFASYHFPVKPGRGALLLSFVLFTPLSLFYRRALSARTHAETARKHFLVLGAGDATQAFVQAYRSSASRQALRLIDVSREGFVDKSDHGLQPVDQAELFAELDALGPDNDGIILTVPVGQLEATLRERLVRLHFQRTPVYTLDSFYEIHWRRIPVFALDPAWPLQIGFQLVRNSPYRHLKRLCDVVSAALGLVLLSPLLLILALLTWWDSGYPVLFRQERVGCAGKPFTILKFRSMYPRPFTQGDDLYTRTNDARITRVGRWLRKLRLDELPQLWNVFVGDMSLIGPRAEWVKCAERYEGKIPSYHFRHLVKPGITGWAQVNYSYGENEEDALQKLKYDLYYIRRYSLRLDAMIVLKTLHVMCWGKGQ